MEKNSQQFQPTEFTYSRLSQYKEGALWIAGEPLSDLVHHSSYGESVLKLWRLAGVPLSNNFAPEVHQVEIYGSPLDYLKAILGRCTSDDPSRLWATMGFSLARYFGLQRLELWSDRHQAHEFSRRILTSLKPLALEDESKIFDQLMVVHLENDLNLSTVCSRLGQISGASLAHAMLSSLCVLSGSLHGGAAEHVMNFASDVALQRDREAYLREFLKAGGRVMGFGHLLYKEGDPRALILKNLFKDWRPKSQWLQLGELIEQNMLKIKNLRPNVDFYSGLIQLELGLPSHSAPAIFAVARSAGWIAHYFEQKKEKHFALPVSRFLPGQE